LGQGRQSSCRAKKIDQERWEKWSRSQGGENLLWGSSSEKPLQKKAGTEGKNWSWNGMEGRRKRREVKMGWTTDGTACNGGTE